MMKFLIGLMFVSSVVMASSTEKNRILPVTKEQEAIKKDKVAHEKLKMLDEKEEDCDEKAKKPVEITPTSISLTGNAGCSLDDAN
jgi:hypothetical protein